MHRELGAGDALGDRLRHLGRRAGVARAGDDQRRAAHRREAIEPVDAGDGVAARDVAGRVGAQQLARSAAAASGCAARKSACR